MALIRIANTRDAAELTEIYKPYVSHSAISFELAPPGTQEIAERIAQTLVLFPWLVCELNGELAGYAYASPFNARAAYQWSVNTAVYVRTGRQRNGLGRALYTSLIATLRLQGFYTAHAGITLPNAASVGLHEALGYRRVGVYESVGFKLGAWHDVGWWQLPLRERTGNPAPPRPLADTMQDPRWVEALSAGIAFLRY